MGDATNEKHNPFREALAKAYHGGAIFDPTVLDRYWSVIEAAQEWHDARRGFLKAPADANPTVHPYVRAERNLVESLDSLNTKEDGR